MANNKDGVEFRLFDTDLATILGVLPAAEMKLDLVLNEPGSGSVKIPLKSNAAAQMESAMFAEGKYRGGVRGGFFVENIEKIEAASGENEAQQMSISGRGALALLDDAIVWDDGTGATTRDLSGTRAGMLIDLIEEAKARGALLNLDYDFTNTIDSNGTAWTDDGDLAWAVDTSLLEVARLIAKTGIDLDVVPDGSGNFVLSAYKNGKGSDKSNTVYFRIGVNCEEVSSLEAGGEIRNVLRVRYKTGSTTVSDATSISTRRRREKGLNARETQTSDSARTIGAAELELSKDPMKSITVTIYDGKGPRVFVDYVLGDYITLDNKGVKTVYRVRGIQAAWDGRKYADVVVDLNSIILEHEIRMAQDISWLKDQWETARDANLLEVRYWAAIGDVAGTLVNALAVSDAGKLYVVGDFASIANVSASNVAVYDLNTGIWSALGSGFNDTCYSIVCDGTTIYFSGDFTDADGVTVSLIASLNETTGEFSALGSGLTTGGKALVLNGSTLWAAQYASISKWTGSWTHYEPPFGFFVNGITNILSMAVDNGIIYVGGQAPIDSGAGIYGSDLYKYVIATDTWTKITTALDPSASVYALAVLNGYLYVGGNFTVRNGTASTRHLAKVSLSSLAYSTVGGGMSGSNFIYALHVIGADLYIGGAFTTIGTDALAALRIAKWDGESFSMLDTGLDNTVLAITHDHNNLLGNIFAGGTFANAGDKPLVKVGEYITNFEALLDHMENSSNSTFDLAAAIHGANETESLADFDEVPIWDSVLNALRKITWQNIRLAFSSFFVSVLQTAGRVLISDNTGTVGVDAGLRYDSATGELSLGDAVPHPVQNKSFHQGSEGLSAGHFLWTWGTGFASFIAGVFARGSFLFPTAAQLGDIALKLRGRFYDGSTYGSANSEIRFVAAQNQTTSAHGGQLEIHTIPNGATALELAAIVGQDKSLVVVGPASASNLSGTNLGDVTLAGTPNYITILGQVITRALIGLSHMANVATGTIFFRRSAGTGSPEVQTLATLKTDLGLSGTNTGDQNITLGKAVATVVIPASDTNWYRIAKHSSNNQPAYVEFLLTSSFHTTIQFKASIGAGGDNGMLEVNMLGFYPGYPTAQPYNIRYVQTGTNNESYIDIQLAGGGGGTYNIIEVLNTTSGGNLFTYPCVTTGSTAAAGTSLTFFNGSGLLLRSGVIGNGWTGLLQYPDGSIYATNMPTTYTTVATTWVSGISSLGNASVNSIRYARIGSTIDFALDLVLGSTTSFTAGTDLVFWLPVTPSSSYSSYDTLGAAALVDAGTNLYMGQLIFVGNSQASIRCINSAGTYAVWSYVSNTVPFTWGNGDQIRCNGRYFL